MPSAPTEQTSARGAKVGFELPVQPFGLGGVGTPVTEKAAWRRRRAAMRTPRPASEPSPKVPGSGAEAGTDTKLRFCAPVMVRRPRLVLRDPPAKNGFAAVASSAIVRSEFAAAADSNVIPTGSVWVFCASATTTTGS